MVNKKKEKRKKKKEDVIDAEVAAQVALERSFKALVR